MTKTIRNVSDAGFMNNEKGADMNNEIKFSHEYPKLHNQSFGQLLKVKVINLVNGPESSDADLIEYDTSYFENGEKKHYELSDGIYLLLVFLGDRNIPFTTIRMCTVEKQKFYASKINEKFNIRRT